MSDRPRRPLAHITFDLETALAYKERYQGRPATDRWAQMMRDDNEADILRLRSELAEALAGETERGA
jgi:hypothetical protein